MVKITLMILNIFISSQNSNHHYRSADENWHFFFCQYISSKFLSGIFKSILQTYSSHYYLYSYICIRPIHKLIHSEVNNYEVRR